MNKIKIKNNVRYYHVWVLVKTKNENKFRKPDHIDKRGSNLKFAWDITNYKDAVKKARYLTKIKDVIKVEITSIS